MRIFIAAAGIACLAGARTADAQARTDADGLPRAVAAMLADSILPRLGRPPVYIQQPATPFDSAVATLLRTEPGTAVFTSNARPPAYVWTGTRGYVMRGDTAAVMVEWGTTSPTEGLIDTYIEENLHLFVRDGAGWRYVGHEFVRGMDAGPVRG